MKEDIAKAIGQQTAAAFEGTPGWSRYAAFVGLDVHKETIAVAVTLPGRDAPEYRGEIAHEPKALKQWLDRLGAEFGGGAARHGPDRPSAAGVAGLVIGAGGRCAGGLARYRQTGRHGAAGRVG